MPSAEDLSPEVSGGDLSPVVSRPTDTQASPGSTHLHGSDTLGVDQLEGDAYMASHHSDKGVAEPSQRSLDAGRRYRYGSEPEEIICRFPPVVSRPQLAG